MLHEIGNPWQDEKDWLASLVWLADKYDPRERMRTADEIGHLMAFAQYSNTRTVGKVGEDCEDYTIFRILFSFRSETEKQQFLHLVHATELTNHESDKDGQFTVPSPAEIEDAEAPGNVLPPDIAERATLRAMAVFKLLSEGESEQRRGRRGWLP